MRRSTVVAVLALVAPGLAACDTKDPAKCDAALATARQAIASEQSDVARQWREYAWKICGDPTKTAPLDQEIVAKEAEVVKRAEDAKSALVRSAQMRMDQATSFWRKFDALAADKRTKDQLETARATAARTTEGLPADLAKQIEDYNAHEYEKRVSSVKK